MAMAMSRAAVAAAVLLGGTAAFEPFADVEELKPRRLSEFCGEKDKVTGRAQCSHSVQTTLHDGGDVSLDWHMEVDPDTILSLDTEGSEGVRLSKCSPGELEMEVPEAYAGQVREGTVVVASKFAHNCRHLETRNVFNRITKVQDKHWVAGEPRKLRARLAVDELDNFASVAHSVNFNFSYMPVEARDVQMWPEMRTDFGQKRRLGSFDEEMHDGNPETKSDMSGGIDALGSVFKFTPKQLSNFGWNWDFYMNSTEEPEFNYTFPGMQGFMKLKQPYIKIHAGLFLKFQSKFQGLTMTPHVQWKAGILGHGVINARMMTDMKTTAAVSEDPFHIFEVPGIEALKKTHWFGDMNVALGALPFDVKPGFSFKVEMYHKGNMEGTIQLGGITHAEVYPVVMFDSHHGLAVTCRADFKNTTLNPPLWIIETDHFEMGIQAEPVMWIKGQLGHERANNGQRRLQFNFGSDFSPTQQQNQPAFQWGGAAQQAQPQQFQPFGYQPQPQGTHNSAEIDEKVGFELRPFLNLTISREEDTVIGDEMRQLVAYPFRVINVGPVTFKNQYIVKVSYDGKELQSSPEYNYGQVDVTDHLNNFDFGNVAKKDVMSKPISVSIVQVNGGVQQVLGSGSYVCQSLLNGECTSEPALVEIPIGGSKAYVELAVLWMNNPAPWFASRIRGVDLSFSDIKLNQANVEAAIPELKAGGKPTQDLFLRITHGGRTYVEKVNGFKDYTVSNPTTLSGNSDISFGTIFVESFKPCGKAECNKGKIDLYYGSQLIASSPLPAIPWSSVPDLVTVTDTPSDKKGSFMDMFTGDSGESSIFSGMASMMGEGLMTGIKAGDSIPLSISLNPVAPNSGSTYTGLAFVHATANVVDPLMASGFLSPVNAASVSTGGSLPFIWTTGGAVPTQKYTFKVSTWTLSASAPTDPAANAQYPSVGDRILQPVAGGNEQITGASCSNNPVDGMDAKDTPCSFQHLMQFDASKYPVGTHVVVMVEWTDSGVTHQMQSPPIQVVTSAPTARRLGAARKLVARRLWTEQDWNERLAAHADSCSKKDLHFKIDWGMMYRARMLDANKGHAGLFPMMMSSMPLWSTGFQPLAKKDMLDSDMAKELPKWLCSDGVCSGMMPGCTKPGKTRYFPVLGFTFNRQFHYSQFGHMAQTLKPVMAYAFSTLPEMVEVIVTELNQSMQASTTMAPPPTTSLTASLAWPAMATPVAPAPAPYQWGGAPGRRLRSSGSEEEQGEREGPVSGVHVTLRFPQGSKLVVDGPLLDMMMRHGMFQDFEDDLSRKGHGMVSVKSYEVYDDGRVPEDSDAEPASESWYSPLTRNARATVGVAALAGAAVLAAVVSMAASDVRRRRYFSGLPEQNEVQEGGALE